MTLVVHLVTVALVFILCLALRKSLIQKYVGRWDELTAGTQVKRWLLFGLFAMVIPFNVAAISAVEIFGFSGSKFYHSLPHLLNFYYFCPLPKKWLQ